MKFLDLHDDVKIIIANCTSDCFVSTMFMSKPQDLRSIIAKALYK